MYNFSVSFLLKKASQLCERAIRKAEKQATAAKQRKDALAEQMKAEEERISDAKREQRIAQSLREKLATVGEPGTE